MPDNLLDGGLGPGELPTSDASPATREEGDDQAEATSEEEGEEVAAGADSGDDGEQRGGEDETAGEAADEGDGEDPEKVKLRAEAQKRRKQHKVLKGENQALRSELEQMRSEFKELKSRFEAPADPVVPEDASPQQVYEALKQQAREESEQERLQKLEEEREAQVTAVRSAHEDYDYLWTKWKETFAADPVIVRKVHTSSNQPAKFYELAAAAEAREEEMEMGDDPARQAIKQSLASPQGGKAGSAPAKRGTPANANREAYEEAKRLLPGVYRDYDHFVESTKTGNAVRSERRSKTLSSTMLKGVAG